MSAEGERLLLQIDALLKKLKTSEEGTESKVEYSFEKPDVDVTRSTVLGIISILVSADNSVEPKLRELLNNNELREKIINIKSSDTSIKEDIEQAFVDIIQGKKVKVPKHNKKVVERARPLRNLRGTFYSIANLKALLNDKLYEAIKKNMGKGSASSILNFRTGRFARSAKVVKLVNNREGHIDAFYTYMKYPYQTFEPGFKQGTPPTRNPKLLIAKSMREVAATIVTNRLKAILV